MPNGTRHKQRHTNTCPYQGPGSVGGFCVAEAASIQITARRTRRLAVWLMGRLPKGSLSGKAFFCTLGFLVVPPPSYQNTCVLTCIAVCQKAPLCDRGNGRIPRLSFRGGLKYKCDSSGNLEMVPWFGQHALVTIAKTGFWFCATVSQTSGRKHSR